MTPLTTLATEAVELARWATPGPWIYDNVGNGVWREAPEGPPDYGSIGIANDTFGGCGQLIAHAGTHYSTLAQGYLDLVAENAELRLTLSGKTMTDAAAVEREACQVAALEAENGVDTDATYKTQAEYAAFCHGQEATRTAIMRAIRARSST
jgi:hypothetical protein